MPPLAEVVAGEEEERCGKEEALRLVQALIDSEEDVPGLVPVLIGESVEGDEEEPEMSPRAEVLAGEEEERCEEEEALDLVQALIDSEGDVPGRVPVGVVIDKEQGLETFNLVLDLTPTPTHLCRVAAGWDVLDVVRRFPVLVQCHLHVSHGRRSVDETDHQVSMGRHHRGRLLPKLWHVAHQPSMATEDVAVLAAHRLALHPAAGGVLRGYGRHLPPGGRDGTCAGPAPTQD